MDQQADFGTGVFRGRVLVAGMAEGVVLFSDVAISFWGGVDPATGIVIDQAHPLCGQCLAGVVLVVPGGRGSCTGSAVLMQLIANGKAPAGMVLAQAEEILTLGVIVAEEMFGLSMPMTDIGPRRFSELKAIGRVCMDKGMVWDVACVDNVTAGDMAPGPAPSLTLSDGDTILLSNDVPEATRLAMRVVVRMAELLGADCLIDISQVHIDGCIYTGPASLEFAETLARLGGRVKVPTSLNAISVDQAHWQQQGTDPALSVAASALADAYVRMGAQPTFTCAPYQLPTAPKAGENIAWAESNAVVYANSVLGARTMKYPDFLDLCIAITGRAPHAGCHLSVNRRAKLKVMVEMPEGYDESFYPLLGYQVGLLAPNTIPLIVGLEHAAPGDDDLKAFGAAFATTSAAPMFHILGVTPESGTMEQAAGGTELATVHVGRSELAEAWQHFNGVADERIDLVALGNPHFSVSEFEHLARLCKGRRVDPRVKLTVTTSRANHAHVTARELGKALQTFGASIVLDACWCTVMQPIVPPDAKLIMTNSGKYAHYGPGLSGKVVRFGSLGDCVDAACSGYATNLMPAWLA
jgi:predicted aconitase/predicted aconitase with swiveling domain